MSDPLPRGQQIFLQRLMASHTMTDDEARTLLQKLAEQDGEDVDGNAGAMDSTTTISLTKCFESINEQLKPSFGLEIVTMIDPYNTTNNKSKKIHAVIDAIGSDDRIAAHTSYPHICGYQERVFFRAILQKIVDNINDGKCTTNRSTLINLRTETTTTTSTTTSNNDNDDDDDDDNNNAVIKQQQLTLDAADEFLEQLLEENYLIMMLPQEQQQQQSKQQRRESMNAKIGLGPRAYMELRTILVDMGMTQDEMPQMIFYKK